MISRNAMTLTPLRSLIATLTVVLLSACGASGPDNSTASAAAPAPVALAAPAPVQGDCANSACTPPVIDGLAEEYRHQASARKVDADQDDAVPVYPRVASNALERADPVLN